MRIQNERSIGELLRASILSGGSGGRAGEIYVVGARGRNTMESWHDTAAGADSEAEHNKIECSIFKS